MGREEGKYGSLLPERGSKELQDTSSPSKKHQDDSLAPSHSTEKIAMISTAKGTGAGWIFVRVLACVGWGWLGFFAFTQINLEMECRGASFIVAQLRKMLICSFCEGLGDNVPLAFTVAAHFSTMDTSVCFFFAHSWGMYVSSIYVVCFLCISDLLFSLFRQSLLTD